MYNNLEVCTCVPGGQACGEGEHEKLLPATLFSLALGALSASRVAHIAVLARTGSARAICMGDGGDGMGNPTSPTTTGCFCGDEL